MARVGPNQMIAVGPLLVDVLSLHTSLNKKRFFELLRVAQAFGSWIDPLIDGLKRARGVLSMILYGSIPVHE